MWGPGRGWDGVASDAAQGAASFLSWRGPEISHTPQRVQKLFWDKWDLGDMVGAGVPGGMNRNLGLQLSSGGGRRLLLDLNPCSPLELQEGSNSQEPLVPHGGSY